MEARTYETASGDHVLAATDGSVRQSDGKMGAGCVFAGTNDYLHRDPSRKLVALTDSISLMLILDGWDRQDFIQLVELQKHKDVIVPLARKLAERTGETVLVKVKSHMGVALNEEADVEANKGLLSN
eukprot:854303-Rhodomonas_salina.3